MDTAEDIIRELVAPPAWMRDALCREYPDVEFFVIRGENSAPAKAICARCVVKDECLGYAIDNAVRHGIWGGRGERERRRLQTGRTDARIEWRGRSLTVRQWATETGLSRSVIQNRLTRGWTIERTLTEPPHEKVGRALEFDGESRTLREWAEHLGISQTTLQSRLAKGWPVARALSEPAHA